MLQDRAQKDPGPTDPRAVLEAAFRAAVSRAHPGTCLPPHLPAPPQDGRLLILGAGKAAAAMAQAAEAALGDEARGVVVTRTGYSLPTQRIEVLEAAHPVPDATSMAAADRLLAEAAGAAPGDMIVFLLSGGASALLAAPARGLGLADKQAVTRALLRSGATISEINTVRRHLSRIKGGRLAQACRGRLLTLAISDVPGDDPAAIASGPTVPDPTTLADARAVLARHGIDAPARVTAALADPANETAKPGDPAFARTQYRLIATPGDALEAAAEVLRRSGYAVEMLGDAIEGEAREVARAHARLAIEARAKGARRAILSGGELTVTIRGKGTGGPNREYALALALALDGAAGIWALAGDSDGADGAPGPDGVDVAGATVTPDTLARSQVRGLDAKAALTANDSGGFFHRLGDAVITGPTQTNVNDVRVILID
ncbi:glycerate kinase [Hyphomicrobiales bacterium FT118]|uniref:Glycerate kinase n=1 Tax=Futiania mangrovi TaxID=2959716 RepID=A0A9J6PFF5_9PROT|nr:glycerate kinase [Futiania mangrovii]MCP1334842.1 glycerate kinase [Futiania mangrovii]